jgi:hypothetical protein
VEQTIVVAERPQRNRITGQVIMVLLLVTFPLLALLVLEQGRVIDAQRLLIQQLSGDSQQLSSMRVRDIQNRAKQAAPSTKAPPADTQQQPGAQPKTGTRPQAGTQPRAGAAPQAKNRKRRQTQETPPLPPQEYPGTRPLPVRKSA